ncbi:hypothetical protein CD116_06390 [Staphylococcus schweitzeri]|uniref:Nitrogen regulation protein NIFR3 n=1 Tax=Staphylococcus schweitzeri TaxID=1654388 RepID=A0A2K4AIE5_9STAP|nr:hypothetical protein CD116_06390 [Staphylococcus schweitzeri]
MSTGNARWGAGPQHRGIGYPISTSNASWGNSDKEIFFL